MKNWFSHLEGVMVLENEPLAKYTWFHIGGNADYFIKVYSKRALKKILQIIKKRRLKYFLIGAGSNLLVSDKGFRGVVIRLEGNFKKIYNRNNYFYCGAGVKLENLLKKAQILGYGGAEFLAGIPGSLGGAIKGNAGAFGHALADITQTILVLNEKLQKEEIGKNNVGFAYRTSRLRNDQIILSAQIKLIRKDRKKIINTIKRNLKYRVQHHPVEYSAGSFFKNPEKYSSGKLIEACGLKGLRIGDAAISRKHANFIVNLGQAKASDVLKLAKMVKKIVREKKGIKLKAEVRILD